MTGGDTVLSIMDYLPVCYAERLDRYFLTMEVLRRVWKVRNEKYAKFALFRVMAV
ncbi:MAG: hypothetical protein ACI8Z5_001929 [Lentimonas sp.]|jgi:hypothetical protein